MYRNGDAGVIADDSDGTWSTGSSSHDQSDGGVVLGNVHDAQVLDSDLRFNPSGIEASQTDHLQVRRNNASQSLAAGFELGDGIGMVIAGNTANGTGAPASRSRAGSWTQTASRPGSGADITGNTTNDNAGAASSSPTAGTTSPTTTRYNNGGFGLDIGEDAGGGGRPPTRTPTPRREVNDDDANRATGNAGPRSAEAWCAAPTVPAARGGGRDAPRHPAHQHAGHR